MSPLLPSPVVSLRRSRGVGIVTAIFLLVVLAALGVAMVSINSAQQSSSALDVQGARAYQAARAGIEWGLYRVKQQSMDCTGGVTNSFNMPAGTTLSTFAVTVVCTKINFPVSNAGTTASMNKITATACNKLGGACPNAPTAASPNPDYVQRVLEVQF